MKKKTISCHAKSLWTVRKETQIRLSGFSFLAPGSYSFLIMVLGVNAIVMNIYNTIKETIHKSFHSPKVGFYELCE